MPQKTPSSLKGFSKAFFFKFIYFIFGCIGSSVLRAGFL